MVKVKMRDDAPPISDKDLVQRREYFSSLLNNDNGRTPSDLSQPAAQDLPIHDHPPTLETLEAIRQMKRQQDLTVLLQQKLSRVAVMQCQMLSIASLLKWTQI